eukprot:14115460-Ditylum_brightwellii.AAC.1
MSEICCKVQWKFETAGYTTEDIWNLRSLFPDMIYMRSIVSMIIFHGEHVSCKKMLTARLLHRLTISMNVRMFIV